MISFSQINGRHVFLFFPFFSFEFFFYYQKYFRAVFVTVYRFDDIFSHTIFFFFFHFLYKNSKIAQQRLFLLLLLIFFGIKMRIPSIFLCSGFLQCFAVFTVTSGLCFFVPLLAAARWELVGDETSVLFGNTTMKSPGPTVSWVVVQNAEMTDDDWERSRWAAVAISAPCFQKLPTFWMSDNKDVTARIQKKKTKSSCPRHHLSEEDEEEEEEANTFGACALLL